MSGTSKKLRKRILSFLLAVAMVVTMMPAMSERVMEVQAEEIQKAWFPLQKLCVTQRAGTGSHGANTKSKNAVDFGWDTGREYAFAPFDGKIVRMDKNQHAVWFQSNNKVCFADGTEDIMTVLFLHGSNYSDLKVGQEYRQGESFYKVGGWGTSANDYAYHFHLEVIKGTVSKSGYWPRGNKNVWDGLIVNKTMTTNITSKKGGYTWSYIDEKGTINNPPLESQITISGQTYPTGNLSLGAKFGIRGTIYSTHSLTNVSATIYNSNGSVAMTKAVNPGKNSYDLKGAINNAMVFNNLSTGTYRYVVTATDSKGYSKELINSTFTVGTVCIPNIYSNAVTGGATISMSAENGTIYYTTDGSNPTTSSAQYTAPFTLTNSATVKAIAVNGGASGDVRTANITVGQLSTPTITANMDADELTVMIAADSGATIYYTTDGSNPTTSSSQYTGVLQVKDSVNIKAMAVRAGSANSGVASQSFNVHTPSTPTLKLATGNKIAVGDPANVTWDKQDIAYSYTVKLSKDDNVLQEQTVTGTSCAFTLPEVGKYTITVKANNFKGSSAESYPPVEVTAMAPLNVTFMDYDDTVIATQQVRYGYQAEMPQKNPTRRGYDFKKWDNSAIYSAITQDVVAKAEYSKKRYIVKFEDANGNSLAPQQEVLFEESVILPADPTTDREGYAFMGWRCVSKDETSALDYEKVDADMTLISVFDWANKALPIILHIDSATQESANSYKVSVSMTHLETVDTKGRLLITLKTSNGKMVKTFVEEFTVLAGQQNHSIQGIELVSDQVATQVEISAVGTNGQKTEGTIAESVTAKTTSYANSKYSEWSTATPPDKAKGVETKKMYSYRDRQYTNSAASSLAGWTQYGTPSIDYGTWSGTQATTSYPGSSDALEVEVTGSSTVYNWHHYCNKYSGRWNVDSIPYGSPNVYHSVTTSSMMPTLNMADQGGRQAYGGLGTGAPKCSYNFYAWWLDSSQTTYYYRTRSKYVTYHYWKWGEWSPYSDSAVSPSTDREVREQTYYRYLIPMETPAEGEDLTGETYTQTGTLSKTDLDFTGKYANILVYKNTNNDPTENQLEYVGQTVIGEGNTYDFSFIPMETPDEANSNYIVALALEGTTDLFNIDVIYATRPSYTVTFHDRNGEVISANEVLQGDSAVTPQAPEVEGYTFIGWDDDTTNVQANRTVTAQYKPNEYTVVYVDYDKNQISMETLVHGELLPNPASEPIVGKEFLGWDKILEGQETVSSNMILTAKYDVQDFEVEFVDENGEVIDSQTVAYGEAAKAPKPLSVAGRKFLGWSTDFAWWDVTSDITVQPILTYEKTATTPSYNIEDTYLGGILTLDVPTGEKAYYMIEYPDDEEDFNGVLDEETLANSGVAEEDTTDESSTEEGAANEGLADGSSVSDNSTNDATTDESLAGGEEIVWIEYTEEILLSADAVIHVKTMGDNLNESDTIEIDYSYVEVENPYIQTAKVEMPKVIGGLDETIEVPVTITDNPGLMGAGFIFRYDTEIFDNVTVVAGEVFETGLFTENVDTQSGEALIFWSDVEQTKEIGTLFTISLHAKADIEEGEYSFDLVFSQEDTFDHNFQDVKVEISDNSGSDVTIGDRVLGDINEDKYINNKDVAFIACYLVGKNELSESQKVAADTNGDGKINNKDVSKLARFLVGKETSLGGN